MAIKKKGPQNFWSAKKAKKCDFKKSYFQKYIRKTILRKSSYIYLVEQKNLYFIKCNKTHFN